MTLIVLISLAAGAWGAFEMACNIRNNRDRQQPLRSRIADVCILIACLCIAVTAIHSLVCIWIK